MFWWNSLKAHRQPPAELENEPNGGKLAQQRQYLASKMLSWLLTWLQMGQDTPGALTWMSLGPDKNSKNPLMVRQFSWGCTHLPDLQRSNSSRGIALTPI